MTQPMPSAYTSELAGELAADVLDRFLRYARVDTQSVRDRKGSPSTPGQLDLLRMLVGELHEIGLEDAALDDNGYVYATLPSTNGSPHAVGLIAHVDVSPDAPGAGVEPIVHRDYDGARVELPRGGTVLDPADMPVLAGKVGHDVVTSSGDTLLGADDKAGVAEIMAAVAYLAAHPELPRPTLKVGFTPDEEIGEGATLFDVDALRRRLRLHARRLAAGRDPGRDVLRHRGRRRSSRASTSTRGGRRASSSTRPGSPGGCSRGCRRTA